MVGGTVVRVSVSRLTVGRRGPARSVNEYLSPSGWSGAATHPPSAAVDLKVCPVLDTGDNLENLLVAVGTQALHDDPVGLILYGHALLGPRFGADPGFADRVRAGLGLSGVPFFGISQVAGTAVLQALDYARRYLDRQATYDAFGYDSVLVLGGDQGGTVDSARPAPGSTSLGDAAVAFLVRPDHGRYRYLGGATARDPRFHRGQRLDATERHLFDQVCGERLLACARDALRTAGLRVGDIDWVMPQAGTALCWQTFARGIGIAPDRICLPEIPVGGHTLGVDALVALAGADRVGRLSPGDRCLLVAIGEGAYFQASVVQVTTDRSGPR
jgi:3-oxoacyl-[acyl-carrier-protein] synthase III